jgi:hypothetical protein
MGLGFLFSRACLFVPIGSPDISGYSGSVKLCKRISYKACFKDSAMFFVNILMNPAKRISFGQTDDLDRRIAVTFNSNHFLIFVPGCVKNRFFSISWGNGRRNEFY